MHGCVMYSCVMFNFFDVLWCIELLSDVLLCDILLREVLSGDVLLCGLLLREVFVCNGLLGYIGALFYSFVIRKIIS